MLGDPDLEAAATLLDASESYRVLRRLAPRTPTGILPADDQVKTGVILDVETTGLDPERDEIIELGMVRFSFSTGGEVLATDPPFSRLRQPSKSIPAEITRLTGITDEMVAGKAIDAAEVEGFVEPAVIVIAHNAGFDRRFVERAFPIFVGQAWGCSISDVPWREEGFEGSRLAYLPKGTDLSVHSQAHLNTIARQLNERPRKTLQFETPAEKFNQCVAMTG